MTIDRIPILAHSTQLLEKFEKELQNLRQEFPKSSSISPGFIRASQEILFFEKAIIACDEYWTQTQDNLLKTYFGVKRKIYEQEQVRLREYLLL